MTAAAGFDALSIVTLVVAIVGAVTGALSLGWAVVSHRDSGVRIAVDFAPGLLNGAGFVTIDPASLGRRPSAHGTIGQPVFIVTVRNVGRLPARVSGVKLHTAKLSFQTGAMPASPTLPKTVDVSDSAIWFFDGADAAALVSAAETLARGADKVWAEVRLGSGVVRHSSSISFRQSVGALQQLAG